MKLIKLTEGRAVVQLEIDDCRTLATLCETADNSLGDQKDEQLSTLALAYSTAFVAMATATEKEEE